MDDAVAAIVAEACRKDPSLPADTALSLAQAALDSRPDADGPEIARLLLADHAALDASWANVIATTVADLRTT
jgi:hypothetical protein